MNHDIIDFVELYENFLSIQTHIPLTFETCASGAIFKNSDYNFEQKWCMYHENNCSLQILCKSCNCSKPKKFIKNNKL